MPRKPSLSVFFPAYNEEENIRASVEGTRRVLAGIDYEIIIIDDASTDKTGALADEFARIYPEVRVIHHERNYKLGRSMRDGFEAAAKDLVFYTDADLPIDFNDIPRGLSLITERDADAVIGYRIDRGDEPWYRSIYSFIYNTLVNCLFDLRVRDVNFSYKLIKRGVLQKFRLTSAGSFIDAELLARIKATGAKIVEMPVKYYPRTAGVSTLARPGIIIKILGEMASFWWGEWRRRPRPSRVSPR